jgi:para-nitrobenzyl esterase
MKIKFLILAAFFLTTLFSVTTFADNLNNLTVKTNGGLIKGKQVGNIRQFLGIPYAKAPIGNLRWKPTQSAPNWKGIKTCTDFGAACPQPPAAPYLPYHQIDKMSEDCLFLNIWSPAKTANEKLPVMLWIHGGGFYGGSSSARQYNCQNLAKKGVVMVSINYRLGPLGFLTHPLLNKESKHNVSGNYGILDQIAALKWVQKNIAVFGGDPNKVTIFGESAGAASATLLSITPLAKGLFRGVIAESGNPMLGIQDLMPDGSVIFSKALAAGESYIKTMGCNKTNDILSCMRNKTPTKCNYDFGVNAKHYQFSPVFDGHIFPASPMSIYEAAKQSKVNMIIGTNAHESKSFPVNINLKQYKTWLDRTCGKFANTIYQQFPVAKYSSANGAYYRYMTIRSFAEPARYVAKKMSKVNPNIYLYQFTRIPNTKIAKIIGAYHSIELEYVFGVWGDVNYKIKDFALSNAIMSYWTNFAKTGNPNNGSTLPEWPQYKPESHLSIDFGNTITVKTNVDKEDCDAVVGVRVEQQKQLQNSIDAYKRLGK